MSIVTLVNSIKDEIKVIKDDLVSSDELYNQRIAECKQCEHYREETYQCRECGCFVPFKAQIKKAQCPLRKW